MRAIIRFDNEKNRISITGYLNWYVVTITIALIFGALFNESIILKDSFNPINLLFIFIILCYLILKLQYYYYNKVYKYFESQKK